MLFQVILDKIHPTVRKDCNYSNLEKIKQEAVWSDEQSRWRVPDLIVQKTKLPPAGKIVPFLLLGFFLLFLSSFIRQTEPRILRPVQLKSTCSCLFKGSSTWLHKTLSKGSLLHKAEHNLSFKHRSVVVCWHSPSHSPDDWHITIRQQQTTSDNVTQFKLVYYQSIIYTCPTQVQVQAPSL